MKNKKVIKAIVGLVLCASLSPMTVWADTGGMPSQERIETRIALSGKAPNIIVDHDEFAKQLNAISAIELNYSEQPATNIYVFFDPNCTGCQGIETQLTKQFQLYSDNKVNVQIIPIGARKEGRMKAVGLYADNPLFLDKTVRELKDMVNRNTAFYNNSFDNLGTPLVVWETTSGFQALKGFPSQNTNKAFLKTVAQKKGIANWMLYLSGGKNSE